MTDQHLKGRVAVVTGGSRGLGLAIAQGFARAGADLIIASRKVEACERAAESIRADTGRRAVAMACHVGKWDDLQQLVHRAYAEFETVDVLVNNAGMSPLYPSLSAISEDLFDKVVSVNFKGPFRLSALFGERMKEAGRGSIINISSVGAVRPTPRELPYASAKAAMNAMTVGFAVAYGPEVRVNTIMPGPFMTDVTAEWDLEQFEAQAQRFPARRGGRSEEIVGAAVYLASDVSSYTTGSIMTVDGGSSLVWQAPGDTA